MMWSSRAVRHDYDQTALPNVCHWKCKARGHTLEREVAFVARRTASCCNCWAAAMVFTCSEASLQCVPQDNKACGQRLEWAFAFVQQHFTSALTVTKC